jgi:hypothetical protein
VLQKLTKTGFTVNASKCNFYKTEKSFLGHRIGETGVAPFSKRIEAILSYPPPKNQKRTKFLDVCNYHHRLIVGYADFVVHLLALLKRGTKWKWTSELQKAFETLRAKFANSTHLVHPDVSLPYTINSDASGRAIGAVLMQTYGEGETIVSTATRVLNPTEQRYSDAEEELLAIVFVLQKLRIYVFGREIELYTDNKVLSFINSCALTSSRISRWILQLQEYDLHVKHISGMRNFLADAISQNPAGTSEKEINPLSPELNSICYLLALLAHEFLHVSRIRVNGLAWPRDIVVYYRLTTIEVGWCLIYRYIFVLFSNSNAASSKI